MHKHHKFTYSPILLPREKKPIHRTWLSQNPTKINSFCNQTFNTSFFMHLLQFPHQDCTKTISSLTHKFCYKGKKSQSTELGKAKTQPKSIPFATKLITPHFLCICDNSPPRLHKNHNLTYSPNLITKAKKPNQLNLAKTKPIQDQVLLQANFSHLIFYVFVTIPQQDCRKTISSLFHQFCYQGKKNQSTELG